MQLNYDLELTIEAASATPPAQIAQKVSDFRVYLEPFLQRDLPGTLHSLLWALFKKQNRRHPLYKEGQLTALKDQLWLPFVEETLKTSKRALVYSAMNKIITRALANYNRKKQR